MHGPIGIMASVASSVIVANSDIIDTGTSAGGRLDTTTTFTDTIVGTIVGRMKTGITERSRRLASLAAQNALDLAPLHEERVVAVD
jgi:hypothetical protein